MVTMRITLRLTILALLALVLVVSPAAAEDVVRISGGGWGHGIGMSQYGAYGRAQRGDSAAQIISHYYSGAGPSQRKMPRRLRVGLVQYKDSIAVTSSPMSDGGGKVAFKVQGSEGK